MLDLTLTVNPRSDVGVYDTPPQIGSKVRYLRQSRRLDL
jgi:hypothetical protein